MSYYPALSMQQLYAPPGRSSNRLYRRNQNTVPFKFGIHLGPVSNAVIIAIMLCVLGLIYLTQVTKTSTYGYEINDLKNKQEKLLSQKSDLEVENARLQALSTVQQSSVAQAMTSPKEVNYVQ